MKARSWLVLISGFGALITLIGLLGIGALRRTRTIHNEMMAAHQAYLEADSFLRAIPTELYLADVLMRDYLLDPNPLTAPLHRRQLLEVRASLDERLDALRQRLKRENAAAELLAAEVQSYWDSVEPIFKWTHQQKAIFGPIFLRQQVLPRRQAATALAREIRGLNESSLCRERRRLQDSQEALESFLLKMLIFSMAVGVVVALVSTYRVSILEWRTAMERDRAERAERELRRLSQKLVQAQEDERRSLSRELHDVVGQMLTGIRMELANLASSRNGQPERFSERLEEAKRLTERVLHEVRDLAMGLRPSMLDDLGLGPALEWQGREFARRAGVPVTVQVDGALENLPDSHRTCIFRVVQEALTNCARHAHARNIRVSVHGRGDAVCVIVQDDGVGFDPKETAGRGLGLIGIEERVRELNGNMSVVSQPRKGAVLRAEIPVRGRAD